LIEFDEFLLLIADQLNEMGETTKEFGGLSEEEMVETAKAVFAEFDDDGSGSISTVELALVFRKMGSSPTEKELNDLVKEVDADGSGVIEFDEFLTLLEKLRKDFEKN
jgi:Ca2+-binding EF-hand superfamily protein